MEKLNFKKVFSKAFIVSLAVMAAANVDALSINETAGKEIEEGSYVIGISKFTPDTVLTAVRVSKATTNDNSFNKDVVGYEGANIYYYELGDWYVLNDENVAVPVTDTKVIKTLTSRDIYYVNNVEKTYPITYKRDIPAGKKLVFETDKPNKKPQYDEANGILNIPVTAKIVTVKLVDEKNENISSVLDTYVRDFTDDEKINFEYESTQSSAGLITADEKITFSKDTTTGANNTLNIGGTIKWDSSDPAGHKIGVILTLPNGLNIAEASGTKVEVTRGNGKKETLTWSSNQTTLKYSPVVKENETITIKTTWTNGTTQTFTIRVTGQLEEMPAGKLSGKTEYVFDSNKNEYTSEKRLTGTTALDGSKVTFSGKNIDWNGNVVVYVEPAEYFTTQADFKYSSITASYTNVEKNPNYDANDSLSTEEEYRDTTPKAIRPTVEEVEGTKVLALSIPLKENNDVTGRTAKVTIDWQNGYKQDFEVILDSNTPFVYPEVGLETTDTADITFKKDEEVPENIDVKGYVKWDINKGGNIVTTTVDASAFIDGVDKSHLKYLSLVIDGKTVTHEVIKIVDGKESKVLETLTFDKNVANMDGEGNYTWDLVVKQGEDHVLKVMYGNAVVKTFNVHISADTEDQKQGTVALTAEADAKFDLSRIDATSYEVSGDYNNTTKKYEELPYNYELGKNGTTLEVTNEAYKNSTNIKVTTKVGAEENKAAFNADATGKATFAVPLVEGKATTVTVEWDAMNKQTFTISPKSGKVEYAKPASGTLALTGGEVDEKVASYTNKDIAWDTDGYKLDGLSITAPTGVTPIETEAYVSISGGNYQNVDKDEDGYFKYTFEEATDKGLISYTNGVIALPINVTESNQTFKITVGWTKNYAVTYTLDIIDANLTNDYKGSKLSIGEVASNNKNEVVYVDKIDFDEDSGLFSIDAKLKKNETDNVTDADIKSIKITDAKSLKVYSQKNGVVTSQRDVRTNVQLTDGNMALYFDEEVKTATIEITWANDYVESFTVDAASASLNKIAFTNRVTEDADTNVGTMTVHVGDEINIVSNASTLPVASINVEVDKATKAYVADKNAVYSNTNGTFTATAAGKIEFSITAAGAEDRTVIVYVLDENDNKLSITNPTVTFSENEGTKIAVSPVGGRDDYSVTVDIESFNENEGTYEIVASDVALTKEFNSNVYSTTQDLNASLHYRYTVKAIAGTEGALVGEYGTTSLEIDDAPKTYDVTFDSNRGTSVLNQTVKAGISAENPQITRASIDGYYYILKGWYEVNSTNFDENGNYKVTGSEKLDKNGDIIIDSAKAATLFDTNTGKFTVEGYDFTTTVKGNITLKAIWYRVPTEK